MILLKQEVIGMLEDNGDIANAKIARITLPDETDADRDHPLLNDLGINVEYLLGRRSEK